MNDIYPVKRIAEAGWLPDKQFQWPAKEIHRFITSGGVEVIQFIIFNKDSGKYELRGWSSEHLEVR